MRKYLKSILFLWLVALLIYRFLICFSYKPEITNGESNNIWKAINVASGKNLYNDPEKLPLEVFQYNPLSEISIIAFANFFDNKNPFYIHHITIAGRCYQLLCSILLAIILFKLSNKLLNINKTSSIIISLTAISFLTPTAFTIRPDATVLVFIFLSIYSFTRYLEFKKIKWLLLTCLFIMLSFLTKQDGLFILFPFGLYLLLYERFKSVIYYSITVILSIIVTLLFLHFTFGDIYWINTFKGLKNTMSLHQLIAVFDRANTFFGFFILTGLILSIYHLTKRNQKLKLLSIIYLLYILISLLISTKIGSWVNYYTPNVILTIILVFGTLHNSSLQNNTSLNLLVRFYLVLSSMVYLSLQCYNYTLPFLKSTKHEYIKAYQDFNLLNKRLPLTKNDFIFVPTPLLRNFYATNNCMVNTEYYHQASFTYDIIKKDKKNKLKYIIFKENERFIVNDIVSFFSIDLKLYELNKLNEFIVYSRKS